MSEHKSPIPSRIYNAAVDGHVCGPEDVDFGQKVVHLVKYDRSGNEVSFESQVNQANKIYVIHDDFTLSSNVTIPENCVLEFDGGSLNNASGNSYTITPNNTKVITVSDNTIFKNIVFNTAANNYFCDSSVVATNFNAISDLQYVNSSYVWDDVTYTAKEAQGTDNSTAFSSISGFVSYSKNIKIYLNGKFYGWSLTANLASYLEVYGGIGYGGMFSFIGCNNSYIHDIKQLGKREKHNLPPATWATYSSMPFINAVGFGGSIKLISSQTGYDNIDCYNNIVENCYVEMSMGGGINLGQGNQTPESIYFAKDCVVRNCQGTHILYQFGGAHAINCRYENCHVGTAMQPFDLSGGCIGCVVSNSIADDAMCGSKLAGDHSRFQSGTLISKDNVYEYYTETINVSGGFTITDATTTILSEHGFYIYGQEKGKSGFYHCTITNNAGRAGMLSHGYGNFVDITVLSSSGFEITPGLPSDETPMGNIIIKDIYINNYAYLPIASIADIIVENVKVLARSAGNIKLPENNVKIRNWYVHSLGNILGGIYSENCTFIGQSLQIHGTIKNCTLITELESDHGIYVYDKIFNSSIYAKGNRSWIQNAYGCKFFIDVVVNNNQDVIKPFRSEANSEFIGNLVCKIGGYDTRITKSNYTTYDGNTVTTGIQEQ